MKHFFLTRTSRFFSISLGLCISVLFSCSKDVMQVENTDEQASRLAVEAATDIQIISCMEVNNTNPLNNLSLKLSSTGEPLIDMVILFSSNINIDPESGEVEITHNENVTHILENKDKYLQPLKDKGIKVILSILGNHDASGVANLDENTAIAFAQKVKTTCETYDLDGVFYDDEYSAYVSPPPAGFVTPSNQAAARLCYQTKLAMPNKLVMVYVYSRTANFGGSNAIPQAQAGQYIDYALHDYLQSYDLTTNFPGLPRSGWGMSSGEYALNRYPSVTALNNLRSGGYGAHMIFSFDPTRSNFSSNQRPALENLATILFDDELVVDDSQIYSKDW